uniref:mitogen-activated protein kinase kinase n=1 Tax=Acrobeloides nanus TaxID=290746 RepID=A0A914CWY4_9BILA
MDFSLEDVYLSYGDQKRPFPEIFLKDIASCIVDGLMDLHNSKIMHRDIKPRNILLNKNGYLKICDFGISKIMEEEITSTINVGTIPYWAPERFNPDPNINGYTYATDIWSTGITLLEVALLQNPFEEIKNLLNELSIKLPNPGYIQGFIKPLEDLYSENMINFIKECLNTNPSTRLPAKDLRCKFYQFSFSKDYEERRKNIEVHVKEIPPKIDDNTPRNDGSKKNTLSSITQEGNVAEMPTQEVLYPDLDLFNLFGEKFNLNEHQVEIDREKHKLAIEYDNKIREKKIILKELDQVVERLIQSKATMLTEEEARKQYISCLDKEIEEKQKFLIKINENLNQNSLKDIQIKIDLRNAKLASLDDEIKQKTIGNLQEELERQNAELLQYRSRDPDKDDRSDEPSTSKFFHMPLPHRSNKFFVSL